MKKKILPVVAFVLIFLAGIGFISYPFLSNWFTQTSRNLEIREYDDTLGKLEAEQIALEWERAEKFNQSNTRWQSSDAFSGGDNEILAEEYLAVLNQQNMMGYIEIPSIKVNLPIKHGTSEKVLSNSVGHLARSHLPIGGAGNHTVLTGHTALPSAVLFSELNKLVIGDMIYLKILDKVLAYEVDDIIVVEPQEVDTLYPVDGEDYLTLITCTPYGVNSHRLLVRGTRVEIPPQEEKIVANTQSISSEDMLMVILVCILILLVWGLSIVVFVQRKRRKDKKDKIEKIIKPKK